MRPERLYRVKVARQLCFCEGRVNFAVTDLMEQNHRPVLPAFQLWNQVVQALFRLGWNGASAQRANRVFHSFVLSFPAREGKKNQSKHG